MSSSLVSSPVRSTRTGSPGFRSQRKISADTITKKIQNLEDIIESLRQQLVFARSQDDESTDSQKEVKPKEKIPTKQKKTQDATEEEKDKIPMPWIGNANFTKCVGLKAQYGLFIQCGKTCDMTSASFQIDNHECRFCNDCSKKCDENGKHPIGTVEERIEAGVGKYVNAKTGKKETIYIEVLEKMGITKEQALDSAGRRGFQIPDWMLEKAEKKRGRPAANSVTVTIATANTNDKVNNEDQSKTNELKEKKTRQPRAKATTTKATTTKATTAKAMIATQDTPQKKNSAQSSNCIDLNSAEINHEDSVTPVTDVASAPQEKEKKKRGRPTKSNTKNNIGESEMHQLIVQATTEKKKRLSLDVDAADAHTSEDVNQIQVETHLTFQDNVKEQQQNGEDEIFEMFDKMLQNEEESQDQQQEQQQEPVVIATNEKKDKSKKAKKSDDKEKEEVEKVEKKKDDKVSKKEAAALKKKAEEEAAALKKAEEEAAALKKAEEKKAEEEDGEETEDENENQDDDEELECEEYEYDGETYGLAPNGDIYSQDGDLVGKLTNGVPNMFN